MNIRYLKLAKLEFHNSIKFYEAQQKGLGKRFENDIKKSIDTILEFPNAFHKIDNKIRKYVVDKFPYNIYYLTEDDTIVILSIASQRKKPLYWIDRV
jgi:plasmid stabilization system protein ParE